MSLTRSILEGSTITVETAFTPPITVDLSVGPDDKPSPLMALLKPRYTVQRQGIVLYDAAPHGQPDAQMRTLAIIGVALAVVVLFILVAVR